MTSEDGTKKGATRTMGIQWSPGCVCPFKYRLEGLVALRATNDAMRMLLLMLCDRNMCL